MVSETVIEAVAITDAASDRGTWDHSAYCTGRVTRGKPSSTDSQTTNFLLIILLNYNNYEMNKNVFLFYTIELIVQYFCIANIIKHL